MTDIGNEVRLRRERLGWTVLKLATLAGVSAGFLSRLERGRCSYSPDTLTRLAGALGISVHALYSSNSNVTDAQAGSRKIPILDYVQAGRWTGVDSTPADEEMRSFIMTDLEHPPSTFAMRIRGSSMEPRFLEGDIVIIDPTIQPKPGDCVVATETSGEATFKQFRSAGRNEAGLDVFELLPLNPLYAPMRSDREALAIVGTMVEHRQYRKR